jgi:hypothetical protein
MATLRIQHSVPSFDSWKRAFDDDPIDRAGSGVRRYSILRSMTNPDLVMIDLEFDTVAEAEGALAKLRQLWMGPGGAVMQNPEAHIVQTVETRSL